MGSVGSQRSRSVLIALSIAILLAALWVDYQYVLSAEPGAFAESPEIDRIRKHLYLALVALILWGLLWVGKTEGLRAMLAIALGALGIWFGFLPLIGAGAHPILVGMACFLPISAGIILIVQRGKIESATGVLAIGMGLLLALALATRWMDKLHFTGYSIGKNEWLYKTGYSRAPGQYINFVHLLVVSVIVGALGAIMDITVDISSTIAELKRRKPDVSFPEALKGGFDVGTDVTGTMVNTLIFAYIGAQLSVFLIPYVTFSQPGIKWNRPLFELMNMEELSFEVANGLIGTIGLILAVPLVSILTSFLLTRYGVGRGLRIPNLGAAVPFLRSGLVKGMQEVYQHAYLVLIAALIIAAAFWLHHSLGKVYAFHPEIGGYEVLRGRVTRQLPPVTVNDQREQLTEYRLTSGSFKDRYAIRSNLVERSLVWINPAVNDRQLLRIFGTVQEGIEKVVYQTYERDRPLVYLALVFLLLLIVLMGKKGLKALLALGSSLLLIYLVLLPMIVRGVSPLGIFAVVATVATVITFLALGGRTSKGVSGVLATLASLSVIGLVCYGCVRIAQLDGVGHVGLNFEIKTYSTAHGLDFAQILMTGILLGLLGALMDVVMAISSAMNVIKRAHPDMPIREIMRSGMNVGRKVMGMMTNTLLFAYTGGALSYFLFIKRGVPGPFPVSITFFMFAEIVLRMLIGALGLILSVPVTVAVNGGMLKVWDQLGWPREKAEGSTVAPAFSWNRKLSERIGWIAIGILAILALGLIGRSLIAPRITPRMSLNALVLTGDAWLSAGQPMEAAHVYWKALDESPENSELQMKLLWAYQALIDMGTAPYMKTLAARLIQQGQDTMEVHYLLGNALQKMAEDEQALAAYTRVERLADRTSLPSRLSDVYFKKGQVLVLLDRMEEAQQAFARAEGANDADALYKLGHYWHYRGEEEHAIRALKRALDLNPDMKQAREELVDAYLEHGQKQMNAGKLRDAYVTFATVVRDYDPDACKAYVFMGTILYKSRSYELAIAAFKRALDCRALSEDIWGQQTVYRYLVRSAEALGDSATVHEYRSRIQ